MFKKIFLALDLVAFFLLMAGLSLWTLVAVANFSLLGLAQSACAWLLALLFLEQETES